MMPTNYCASLLFIREINIGVRRFDFREISFALSGVAQP
jgi:hypothetical protein